ncbi:hypothetical protein GJ744_006525 [Endocarpon pusillum]|uniref:Uncharacterized protein n=1 Tax=Endocarpon pusillum TaxID=364733 RepID=A0A8H7EBM3_9EURO|nr:hypothetical protein GJ744_006525 [Endocarpon pusillum]
MNKVKSMLSRRVGASSRCLCLLSCILISSEQNSSYLPSVETAATAFAVQLRVAWTNLVHRTRTRCQVELEPLVKFPGTRTFTNQ